MKVYEIVKAWLIQHGYDGLYSGRECACLVGDLFPCHEDGIGCSAGYTTECPGNSDCTEEHAFHVGPEKPDEGKD